MHYPILTYYRSFLYSISFNLDKYEEELWRASLSNQNGVENETDEIDEFKSITQTKSQTAVYTSKTEVDFNEQIPVFKSQLPKTLKVEGRERFLLEIFLDGYPLPNGNVLSTKNKLNHSY